MNYGVHQGLPGISLEHPSMAPKLKAGISIWRSGNQLYIGDQLTYLQLPEKIGDIPFQEMLERLINNALEKKDKPLLEGLAKLNLLDQKVTEISYRYRADRFSLSSIDGTRNLALQQFLERFEVESDCASRQEGDIDGGRSKLVARRNFSIEIIVSPNSSNRIAINLFAALKASGFELTSLHLPGESSISDLSGTQMQKCELGINRSDLIRRVERDASLYPEPIEPTNKYLFAISIGAPSPEAQERWLREGVSHLLINYTSDSVRIGPIVIAGKTPCANCLAISEVETGAIPVNKDYIFKSSQRELGSALSNLAAAISTIEVMRFADTGSSSLIGSSATYKGSDLIAPHITNWQIQPRCGCRSLPSTRATSA